jgi:hypothetical protein
MHHHTKASEKLAKLREAPQTCVEKPTGGPLRDMIRHISGNRSTSGKTRKNTRQVEGVYYLYGDERRAVRKFVKLNPDFTRDCLTDSCNPLFESLDPFIYQLLEEEFEIMDYNGEI